MRKRSRAESAAFAVLAGGILIALMPGLRVDDSRSLLTFAAFIFLAGLFDVELLGNRTISLALAPAIGFALLRSSPVPGLNEIAFAVAAAGTATIGVRLAMRRPVDFTDMTTRFVLVVTAGAVYRAVDHLSGDLGVFGTPAMSVPGLLAVLATVLAFEAAVAGFHGGGRAGFRAWMGDFRTAAPVHVAITSVGALLALSYPPLGTWALPLFVAPLAATQYGFRQIAAIRKTYVQTVSALARVPEMAGYTNPGHSQIVASLATDMAREMGLPEDEIAETEYAALLHDIGRVALPDPEERTEDSTFKLELAVVGAGIVEETGHFPRVAQMIREQTEPYRRRGEDVNRDLSAGAKIIKVASVYDDMTRPAGVGRTPWDALERLHHGMAYEYDPAVIQALTRVLEQRNVL